jgi:lysophospholipase L1-like esterase
MAYKQNHIKIYNSLIYGFYRDFFNRNEGEKESRKNGSDTYVNGGFLQKDLTYFKHIKYPTNSWDLNGKQFYEFEKILELIKKKNIKLILVQTPITPNLYNSFPNNNDFDKKMQSYGTYYNFNKMISLDDSLHFYDSHHLNQNGVNIFNAKLIDVLLTEKR